jgi:hypothetical protein
MSGRAWYAQVLDHACQKIGDENRPSHLFRPKRELLPPQPAQTAEVSFAARSSFDWIVVEPRLLCLDAAEPAAAENSA